MHLSLYLSVYLLKRTTVTATQCNGSYVFSSGTYIFWLPLLALVYQTIKHSSSFCAVSRPLYHKSDVYQGQISFSQCTTTILDEFTEIVLNCVTWFLSFCVTEAISGTNIIAPTLTLIAGNSTVNLTCTSTVGKADSVNWLKDGKALEMTSRITFNADKSSITIPTVQKEDAGQYECQLKNKISMETKKYNMTVNCTLINCIN